MPSTPDRAEKGRPSRGPACGSAHARRAKRHGRVRRPHVEHARQAKHARLPAGRARLGMLSEPDMRGSRKAPACQRSLTCETARPACEAPACTARLRGRHARQPACQQASQADGLRGAAQLRPARGSAAEACEGQHSRGPRGAA